MRNSFSIFPFLLNFFSTIPIRFRFVCFDYFFASRKKDKIMISSITSYTNERKSNLLLGFINIFFQKNVYKVIIEIKVKEKEEISIKIDWKNDDDNDDDWKSLKIAKPFIHFGSKINEQWFVDFFCFHQSIFDIITYVGKKSVGGKRWWWSWSPSSSSLKTIRKNFSIFSISFFFL